MTLSPTSSGTVADQPAVPAASPALPVEVVHFTAVTPTLSPATPLTVIAAEEVEMMLKPGDRMVSDGGVLSEPAGGCTGVVGGVGGGDGGDVGGAAGGCAGGGLLTPYRARTAAMSSSVNPAANR